MSKQKQTQKAVEEGIKDIPEITIGEITQEEICNVVDEKGTEIIQDECEETSKLVSKDDVIAIITSAKARASRTAQTSISMPCREVLAMLNGIKDSVEKL